jgi:hypothetical protein
VAPLTAMGTEVAPGAAAGTRETLLPHAPKTRDSKMETVDKMRSHAYGEMSGSVAVAVSSPTCASSNVRL